LEIVVGLEMVVAYAMRLRKRTFAPMTYFINLRGFCLIIPNKTQILAMDPSVLVSMKNAAKRDNYCELQNSVNHRIFERKRR
jgi:hypothetical protein